MTWLARLLRRALFWVNARGHGADLAAEIEHHRARAQEALEAGGLPRADAAARSRRAMGNVTLAREDARDVWMAVGLERAWRDVVYGTRALRREPTFALTALLTLTLGGATTIAVCSVVDSEIWKPLPMQDPRQLVLVRATQPGPRALYENVSGPDFMDWRAQSRLAEYIAAMSSSRRIMRRETAESVTVRPVTVDFLSVLRLAPSLGRSFGPEDEHGPRTAILSDRGWKRLFAGDGSVVGRTLSVDDEPFTIVGVMGGPALEFIDEPDFFVAIDATAPGFRDRSAQTLDVFGRMRPGTGLEQAQSELQAIAARIAVSFPDRAGHGVGLSDLRSYSTGYNWRGMYFFLGAAVLVLILTCLNVANLLVVRALRRQREFAIRGALGGGQPALVRQLIIEGALLAVPGAAAAALVATWVLRWFSVHAPSGYLERGGHFQLDARVAALVLAVAAVTTMVLALTPLLFARRIELNVMLGQGARTAGRSPRQRRQRTLLLVGQVTATLVLLASAGLFLMSFVRLRETPLGFDPRDRLSLSVPLSGPRFAGDAAVRAFSARLIDKALGTPGVRDAAVGSSSPLDGHGGPAVQVVRSDRPRPAPGDEPTAVIRTVSPSYFRTLGIPQIAGRDFSAGDTAEAPRVAIVNELLARRMFPGESPVGRLLDVLPRLGTGWTTRRGTVLIVGVVVNVRNFGLDEVEFNNLYVPFAQAPAAGLELLVSTAIPAAAAAETVRRAAAGVDPAVPVTQITTLTQRVEEAVQPDRFNLLLIGFFAGVAVLLAGVGIYGAMACAVQERTREFGVRIALGATPRGIVGSALWESGRVGLTGGALGIAITLGLARVVGNALYLVPQQHGGLLYGVKTSDPMVLGSAFLALIAVATLSGLVPARQATRIDPLIALRQE